MTAQRKSPLSSALERLGGDQSNYGQIMDEILDRINSYLLERAIRRERDAICKAKTNCAARAHALRMRDLIAMRSPRQVARMERREGLA